jgi:hypothetical protein
MLLSHMPLADPVIELKLFEIIKTITPAMTKIETWSTDSYINTFIEWLQDSKHNTITGFDKYPHKSYCIGAIDGIQSFIHRHCTSRRIRYSEAEFIGSKVISNHASAKSEHLENDIIRLDDAVVVSFPFSGNGGIYNGYTNLLNECTRLNVPVLLDLSYYGISYGLDFNLDHNCVTDVVFSLSKPMAATQLRLGMRLTKEHHDDMVQVNSDLKIYNRIAVQTGIELLKEFSHEYLVNKYINKQIEICGSYDITPTPTLTLALGDARHAEFYRNGFHRICITKELLR